MADCVSSFQKGCHVSSDLNEKKLMGRVEDRQGESSLVPSSANIHEEVRPPPVEAATDARVEGSTFNVGEVPIIFNIGKLQVVEESV